MVQHTLEGTTSSQLSSLLEQGTQPREDPVSPHSIARNPLGHSQEPQNLLISIALAVRSKSDTSLLNLISGKS